jgi:hypothetical protein
MEMLLVYMYMVTLTLLFCRGKKRRPLTFDHRHLSKANTQKGKKRKKTQTHPNVDALEPFQVQHLGTE